MGIGTPRHAFAYARDPARIHILAVTDHGEMLSPIEWEDIKRQADSATIPGRFLGLAGFEWTSLDGHINVFNTSDYTSANQVPTVCSIYRWLAMRSGALGQFNHPGGPFLFDNFRHSFIGDISMTLFEIQNRDHARVYHVALDSGWRVGIAANQDNHFPDWGSGNQLTGIWAESLTRSSILSAIRNMRTFGTLDRNFQLSFKANSLWMGSVIPNGQIQFEVSGLDPHHSDLINRVDIITNNNRILDSLILGNTNHFIWSTATSTNPNERRYFFVRVIENDSDYILSSPIWTEGGVGDCRGGRRKAEHPPYKISPNPFTSSVTITISPNYSFGILGIKIWTVSGKMVKRFPPRLCIRWEGKDEEGRDVPEGIYLLVFEKGRERVIKKILRLRR